MKSAATKPVVASLLAIGLAVASTSATAQSGYDRYGDGYGSRGYDRGDYARDGDSYYDEARVIRVDPVLDGGYRTTSGYGGQRCYETTTAGGYEDGRDGYYRRGNGDYYGRNQGDPAARSMATVAGGIIGAVLGSKVGGGSGRFAATAVGSMVGGIAGREVYDQNRRSRYVRPSTVRVCDPEPVGRYEANRYGDYRGGEANAYDVTYEYNGRQYTRRMDYHPGDRVRVRVDVSPE